MANIEALAAIGRDLLQNGRPGEAVRVFEQALSSHRDAVELWYLLGHARLQSHMLPQAIAAFAEVVKRAPNHREALYAYGVSLRNGGHQQEALETFTLLTTRHRDWAEGFVEQGALLIQFGKTDKAGKAFESALALDPTHAAALFNIAQMYRNLGHLAVAEKHLRELLFHHPDHAGGQAILPAVIAQQGRLGEAREMVELALADGHTGPEIHTIHGNILRDLGELKGAEFAYRAALSADPNFDAARSNLVYAMAFHFLGTPEERMKEMRQYEALLQSRAECIYDPKPRDPRSDRRLRVGYVSAGFHDGILAPALVPVLEAHDPKAVEIICYSAGIVRDHITKRMEKAATYWRKVNALTDDQLAAQIIEDGVDILVDLSGHTADNRIGVFARRSAPIQINWLHATSSIGFTSMDYIMLDEDLLPANSPELLTEQRLPLASVVCCHVPMSPMPKPRLRDEDAPLTFGCFNNLWKLNEKVIRVWAEILGELPEARLLVKAKQLGDQSVRDRLAARFSAFGVAPARIELHGFVPLEQHFQLYHQVDVALDPFPFGGGRTTAEALLMGVPLVTLEGEYIAERLSAGMLKAAGLGAWVARDRDDYVEKAVAWAKAPSRRAALRKDLRRLIERSDLMDGQKNARAVEDAFRRAWRAKIGK